MNEKIQELFARVIENFGPPPDKRGIMPELKWIFDIFLFYRDNKPAITDQDFQSGDPSLNVQMNFYIDERCEHLMDSANVIYGLDHKQFLEMLSSYIKTGQVEHLPQLSPTEMERKSAIIKATKMTNELSEHFEHIPGDRDLYKKVATDFYRDKAHGKDYCLICGDTSDETTLITIVNSDEENKKLCKDCMNNQRSMYGIKFSKIKQNRSYIIHK